MRTWLRFSCSTAAGGNAIQQQHALARVAGHGGGAFELGAGFGVAAEAEQEVAAHAGQQVIVGQGRFADQGTTPDSSNAWWL